MLLRLLMLVINVTTGKEVADSVVVAKTLFSRLKGLLGRKELAAGEGMLIRSCMGVHTVGMRFPIDVIFLDKNNSVVACENKLLPNRMTRIYPRATSVLELPVGIINASSTEIGNRLDLRAC